MPITTINNTRLYWELTGNSGEPLILVHGSWDDHHFWDFVVPDLSQSFRVLTYDRRGHSQSERSAGQGSAQEDMTDLACLIKALDLAPAHIAGISYGGRLVLHLAGQHPELFKSLIVHEPPIFRLMADQPGAQAELDEVNQRVQAVVDLLEVGDIEAGARAFMATIAGYPDVWEQFSPEMKQKYLYNAPTWLDEMHDPEALTLDLTSLSKFPHPALITHGGNSPSYFALIATRIANVLPHVEHLTFSEAGHGVAVTHPREYVKTVREFIGQDRTLI